LQQLFGQYRGNASLEQWPRLRFYHDGHGWAGDRRSLAALSWLSEREFYQCMSSTNAELIDSVSAATKLAHGAKVQPGGPPGTRMSACGYAASFDVGLLAGPRQKPRSVLFDSQTLRFAIVRDPLDRFIGSQHERGRGRDSLGAQVAEYAHRAQQLGALAKAGERFLKGLQTTDRPFDISLYHPHPHEHLQTQSYFLSATDASGQPVMWDALIHADRLVEDLPPVLERILGPVPADVAMSSPKTRLHQAQALSPRSRALRVAMLNRTDIMCPLCRYLAQDYLCLGFAFPSACLHKSCIRTLSSETQQALALDCQRQKWPQHCIDANIHQIRVE
jgi:hypothetical protein